VGKTMILFGAVSGFVSVAAGAFGAHGLKARLEPDLLAIFETGARYQMYHALALVLIGAVALRYPSTTLSVSGWSMVAGTVVFSGSLYLLALTGTRWLGAITPVGGLAFLVGWAALAWAAKGLVNTP
jgi:uncharacterized membrane protein YgdD (TMEM256/DUF423 family)